jgi:carbonic anhydrase
MQHILRTRARGGAALALGVLLVGVGAGSGLAQQADVQTQKSQAALSPAQALELLEKGNQRFTANKMMKRDLGDQVEATATGQYPFAVVLGCIDSRVPTEVVFDQGVGDIFSARVAGNFVNADILGSMEFATAVAGSKVVVVLGHTSCGAVKGACDNVELGNLTQTLSNVAPAVYAVPGHEGKRSSQNKDFVHAVATKNVHLTVQNVIDRSPVMADLVQKGELIVIGAMYDVATGEVTWYEEQAHGM